MTTNNQVGDPPTMRSVTAYATPAAKAPFEKTTIERRDLGPNDILIKVAFAGICHSRHDDRVILELAAPVCVVGPRRQVSLGDPGIAP